MSTVRKRPIRHIEDDNARALTKWARLAEPRIPELHWFYHWPQGGKRSLVTAAILKAMGVKKGPWDYWLFARRGMCPGLVIELKHGKNKLTDEQDELGEYLRGQGWQTAVCYHWFDARTAICDYLGVKP